MTPPTRTSWSNWPRPPPRPIALQAGYSRPRRRPGRISPADAASTDRPVWTLTPRPVGEDPVEEWVAPRAGVRLGLPRGGHRGEAVRPHPGLVSADRAEQVVGDRAGREYRRAELPRVL